MVLSLEEFKQFTPKQNTYALFGYPLGHSMSPELHAALFAASGKNADYIAVEVPPEHLAEALTIGKDKLCGINLTIPHKKAIIPLLDCIDQSAQDLNSVNTVTIKDGKTLGYNTDILGFEGSLKKDGVCLTGKTVLLLGYGGVAAVMGYHCAKAGADLIITGRNISKGQILVRQLKNTLPDKKISFCEEQNLPENVQIIVNGTPVGMYPKETDCPISRLPEKTEYIFDAIYNPPSTALLKLAEGIKSVKTRDGLYMLVLQAAYAQSIWLGTKFGGQDLDSVLRKLYGDLARKRLNDVHHKSNVVLSGFMGSGKTTIGGKLAKVMGLNFVDADTFLEERQKMSIALIFQLYGELYFRDLETCCLRELSKARQQVISTGGGAVLRDENVAMLKNSGLIVHLNTPFHRIVKNLSLDNSRPLLAGDKTKETCELYHKRKIVYRRTADISVRGTKVTEIIDKILKSI